MRPQRFTPAAGVKRGYFKREDMLTVKKVPGEGAYRVSAADGFRTTFMYLQSEKEALAVGRVRYTEWMRAIAAGEDVVSEFDLSEEDSEDAPDPRVEEAEADVIDLVSEDPSDSATAALAEECDEEKIAEFRITELEHADRRERDEAYFKWAADNLPQEAKEAAEYDATHPWCQSCVVAANLN
jgi:hypothetical protein